jgi:hypothetical protein
MASTDDAYEAAMRLTFVRRWRITAVLMLCYAAANLVRPEAPLGHLVPPSMSWMRSIWLWLPLVWVPFFVWACRCPACGGWIRLDGKTCAACHRNLRAKTLGGATGVLPT